MILIGTSFSKVALGFLCISLAILVIVIAYKKLLAYLGKGRITNEKYCVLFSLESHPASGELEFYFTSEEDKFVNFELLNADFSLNQLIIAKDFKANGNIVRFDSTAVKNGEYFYQLRTDNQKTMKKILIQN